MQSYKKIHTSPVRPCVECHFPVYLERRISSHLAPDASLAPNHNAIDVTWEHYPISIGTRSLACAFHTDDTMCPSPRL